MENPKHIEKYDLHKVPETALLAESQKMVGMLKAEIDYLQSEVKRLKHEINSRSDLNFKLSADEKIRMKSDARIVELTKRNKELKAEVNSNRRTISDLIYQKMKLENVIK